MSALSEVLWSDPSQRNYENFYKRLMEGEGRAYELINTQIEFRNHKNKNYRHPSIWAAFQLSGDWRPIVFKK